jgi:hypothetical protein
VDAEAVQFLADLIRPRPLPVLARLGSFGNQPLDQLKFFWC